MPPDTSAGGVAVISARAGKITEEISLPGISGGVGADPKTDSVDLAGPGYAITPIDARTRAVGKPLGSGFILYPTSIAINSKTDVAYAISDQVTGVWFVNLSTGGLFGVSSTKRSNISTTGPSVAVATDPGTGRTYVAMDGSDGSEVATIDGTSGRFAATKQLRNANGTLGIAVDATEHDVYVANANETAGCLGFVDEMSERTGKVIATVYNLADPEAVAVDSISHTRSTSITRECLMRSTAASPTSRRSAERPAPWSAPVSRRASASPAFSTARKPGGGASGGRGRCRPPARRGCR